MLDLAAIRLADAMRNCDDASVMFGLPTAEQFRRVVDSGNAALELIHRAEVAANDAVAKLEARLLDPALDAERAAALAAQIDPLLSVLVERELAVRIPTMRAHAAALSALADPYAPAGQARRIEAVKLLSDTRNSGQVDQARARVLAAALLLRSPDPQEHLSAARRQLEWVVSLVSPEADSGAGSRFSSDEWVRLHMALARCGMAEAAARLPVPGRGRDWLVDLLLAEAALLAANATSATPAGSESRREATTSMLTVLRRYGDADELDSIAEFSALRKLVYEKLGSATGAGTPWSWLDPEAALARTWFLAAANPGSKLDAEGVALLSRVVEREDSPPTLKARALWMLAAEAADPRAHLARIVRMDPPARLAIPAAERLLQLVPPLRDPSTPCAFTWPDAAARADAQAAIDRLLDVRPDDARLRALAIAAAISAAGEPGLEQLEAAAAHHARLPHGDTSRDQTGDCISAAFSRAIAAPLDPPSRQSLLRMAEGWFARDPGNDPALARTLRLDRIEAALASSLLPTSDIIAELQPLLDTPLDTPGTTDRARLRSMLGIALRADGKAAAAIPILRTVADDYEPDARTSDPARRDARQAFWSVWAELIEIVRAGEVEAVAADDTDRARHAQRLRERLELLDPKLGGEPWAGRIRAASSAGDK
jgi:hypothetical protein